jgi:hypothetical protein
VLRDDLDRIARDVGQPRARVDEALELRRFFTHAVPTQDGVAVSVDSPWR